MLDAAFDVFGLPDFQIGASTELEPGRRRGRRRGQVNKATQALREAILDLTDRFERMTVRQVYYALEVAGVVEKIEEAYKRVQRQVLAMRREGLLDWSFITDGTRWQRKPSTWDSAQDYLESMTRHYRRNLWRTQDVRLEIWLEKDALADVIVDVTRKWDVSLMVSRGQSSATFLHAAAKTAEQAFDQTGALTYIYTLYDFDAAGDRCHRAIAGQLPEHAPGVPVNVERLAVTRAQITAWKLPTRPPSKKDKQASKWGGKPCVELDAIPPKQLTALVEAAITRHVDQHKWEIEEAIQAEEREGLLALRGTFKAN
jgi:hypothetical protein